MKRKEILIAMFCLYMHTVTAQHQVTGTIKDGADGSPVSFATAALLRSDSSIVSGAMANLDGKFVIENVMAGNYLLQVSFLGYDKAYRNINVPSQNDAGEITLTESANKLSEVVVTAMRPLVVSRADRYVVNVSGNIQSTGRDALDILRNTPGLLVDQDGNVTLMGKSVRIWIDGRPSQMSGEQLRAFLNSMQGGEIDRIEIVTNPSSRYEAEGSGGIIDIRTRKGLELGVNGTLTAGYTQGRSGKENAGLNLNWRREKINLYGNYSYSRYNGWSYIDQINVIQTPEGEITLANYAKYNNTKLGQRHSVRAGMDYYINPNNIFGVVINTYLDDGGLASGKGTTHISPVYNGVSSSTADNSQTNTKNGIQANINYQSTFAKPGQQLNFDLNYARFNSDPLQKNANRYYDPAGVMIGEVEQFSNANPQTIDVYSAKLDYAQPVWKDARMETGAKFGQTKTDNDLKYEEAVNNIWQPDPGRSNRFIYTEQISAVYINLSQRLGKVNFQAGLRGEYTSTKGEQKTTGEVNDTTYMNLFPTFFVNYQASQMHTFGLSYSRRLNRPGFDVLNPFEMDIDAYTFWKGNPKLTPAYTHNMEMSWMFAKGLMTRIGYSSTADFIFRAPVVDEATQRTGMIWQNFGKSQNISLMANYRRQIVKPWTANLTVQGAYQINTSDEASGEFESKGSSFVVQLNNNLTITPSLSAEVTGMYMSGIRQGYLVIKPQGNLSVGLRQMLLKNKMTLSLAVNDILFTSRTKGYARYENVNFTVVDNAWDSRYVNLTLRYNFGSTTVRAARNKATGIEDEASRAR